MMFVIKFDKWEVLRGLALSRQTFSHKCETVEWFPKSVVDNKNDSASRASKQPISEADVWLYATSNATLSSSREMPDSIRAAW